MNKEYKEKVALKNKLAKYYLGQAKKNGLSDTKLLKKYLPLELRNRFLDRGIIIAHLDFERVADAIANHKPYAIVSGANPSSALHLGHKAVFDLVSEYAKYGGQVFIPLTNDESYVDGKVNSLEEGNKNAHEKIIPLLPRFGLEKSVVFTDSDYPEIYVMAMEIAGMLDCEAVRMAFGDKAVKNVGQMFYRGGVQIAQILLPQIPKYGGPKPTLVPVGIDQHPYVLLARDIAKRMGLVPPSELVIKLQSSLKDPEEKMSKSKQGTAIFLDDSKDVIKKKINAAYTGSVSKLEDHRNLGGVPEIDAAFNLLLFHHPDDKLMATIHADYRKGRLTGGDVKRIATDFIVDCLIPSV